MQQFLEAATLALQAIWANKLRSLLTVLGNIVAVTSIIAVVSLVQGLNASVKDAIQSDLGADTFAVQRRGPTRTDEEEERAASNPRVTLAEADALRTFSPRIKLVMAEASGGAQAKYRQESLDSIQIRGVTKEFVMLPTTDVERGRVITPSEFDAGRPLAILGFDTADRLFGTIDPIDKGDHARRRALPRRRRGGEKGRHLRSIAGRIRRRPARGLPAHLRVASVAAVDRRAERPVGGPGGDGRRDAGDAHATPAATEGTG